MNAESMYQEIIMDYYRNPKNFGQLDNPSAKARDVNPSCGDVVEMHLKINNDTKTIEDIRFSGKGCAISQAAASMITEHLHGKPLDTVTDLKKEQVLGLLGIPISMMRLKCALLGLKVVKMAAYDHMGQSMQEDVDIYGE